MKATEAITTDARLERIETLLAVLLDRQQVKEFYTVEEFARLVGRNSYTVREWARHGRVRANKKLSGREWAFSHFERLRYEREGLLPEGASVGEGGLFVESAL